MTAIEFQSNPDMVNEWRGLLSSTLLKNLLSVILEESPSNILTGDVQATNCSQVYLGRIEGHQGVYNLLTKTLTRHHQELTQPETTFEEQD